MEQVFVKENTLLLTESLSFFRVIISASTEQKSGYLLKVDRTDHYLLKFLRASKFNILRSLELLVNYESTIKLKGFKNVLLNSDIIDVLSTNFMHYNFNYKTIDGHQILYINGNCLSKFLSFPIEKIEKALWYLMEKIVKDEETQKCGISIVTSVTCEISLSFIKSILFLQQKISKLFLKKFPIRIRKIYLSGGLNYFKFLLSDKLKSRVSFLERDASNKESEEMIKLISDIETATPISKWENPMFT